jgi:hypothetical protein
MAYSNHGYTLLGHLIEEVTGERFESYAAGHIFDPLGMRRTSFRLPPALERNAAVGYEHSASGYRRAIPVHPHIYPAAGLSTTAADMARFMLAHLNGGRVGDARILSEAAVVRMHRQQFTMSPAMPGMAFGFFEFHMRGERGLVHGGGLRGFMAGLGLWPEQRLGIFVATNGDGPDLVRDLLLAFTTRCFPYRNSTVEQQSDDPPAQRFAGSYRLAGTTRGSLEKAGTLRGGDTEVSVNYWRRLVLFGNWYDRVAPRQYVRRGGDEVIGFSETTPGGMTYLLTSDAFYGNEAWEPLRWYETSRLHREALVLFCLVFLSVLLVPARWVSRMGRDARPAPPGAGSRAARGLLALVAALDLAFLVLLGIAFRLAGDSGLLYGLPALARFDLRLAAGTAVLALGLPILAWLAWRRGYWTRPVRIHYTAGVAAALAYAGFLYYWNLLGF